MKCKKLLRFYFNADALNKSLDNIILRYACGGEERGAECCARKMLELIEVKRELGGLWDYLNGVIAKFGVRDKKVLKYYGLSRTGVSKLPNGCRLEIKRVVTRFCRKLGAIGVYGGGVQLVDAYYCML